MGTPKSVCLSWFGLISRDKYEHTHLRLWKLCKRDWQVFVDVLKCSYKLTSFSWKTPNFASYLVDNVIKSNANGKTVVSKKVNKSTE